MFLDEKFWIKLQEIEDMQAQRLLLDEKLIYELVKIWKHEYGLEK